MTKEELEIELRLRVEQSMEQFHGKVITSTPMYGGVVIWKVKNVLSEVVEKFLEDYNLEIKIPSDVQVIQNEIIITIDTTGIDENTTPST